MSTHSHDLIAFQGIHGAYSDLACRHTYPSLQTVPLPTFEDVFEAVESGRVTLGMIPIENSQAGRVAEIHNLIPHMNLFIVGECFQKIEHHILALKGARLEDINRVYSHPQALLQCRQHLRTLNIEVESYSDTALAAKKVAHVNDPGKAALASSLAGELYGLEIVSPNLEDNPDNVTFFIIISRESADHDPGESHIITSITFVTRNIPAALYKALGGFATNSINLLKLESYIPGWTRASAQFFITFEGHPAEKHVQNALDELHFFCDQVKILGSYKADPMRFQQ